MPKSSSLSLAMRSKGGKENVTSPMSPRSPGSPNAPYANESETVTPTAGYNTMPESPASFKPRKDSKNIFSNFGATKSSSRIVNPENSSRAMGDHDAPNAFYANGRGGASTPDLNRPVHTPNSDGKWSHVSLRGTTLTRPDNRSDVTGSEQRSGSGRSNDTTDQHSDNANSKRSGSKPKKPGMLTRSKSIKTEEGPTTRSKLNKSQTPKLSPEPNANWTHNGEALPMKTAPLDKGQSWRTNISLGKLRTHSADRHDGTLRPQHEDDNASRKDRAEQSSVASGSFNESRGATFMSSLGFGARKMGEKMETTRKGIFGKLGRSSSNHESHSQIPKEPYQFKIINTPLIEQTRLTRISSRLENSRDKTEFWMPALPWRCIDYLNMKGCEEEGLYRVPGAAHAIKYYEQKFDQDRDVDLIADENLNDPNVIGSLFKNWLRQLPDEIFPKDTQARIQRECAGAKSTPQLLKDELSRLPPFNYYLLFAITCHISLLHSCSEFNKMNYNNLCICFQPAIKIDAFCFQFLILDWRNCWQGCWTEKEYLAEEVTLLENPKPAPAPAPIPNPHRNGTVEKAGKAKSSHSGYLGEGYKSSKPASARESSVDRGKTSTRGVSSDRSIASGRATPPNPAVLPSEKSSSSRRGIPSEREASSDRAISSADSREAFNPRGGGVAGNGTPKRAPPSVTTEPAADDDNSATPTQAQHNRGASESQFRLDLTNPPSSPFSIKF
ncbi:hypothetical protein BS50DRAFT_496974 [Corynespora cassiicola Philippines]|uniref:Rho-GAP domain-containing protein n=1 Tax=Corynespora cassiicola Philippines TaxID=1448308 RepID=A0A2T2NJ05_CORCC|nr:hypothetical protein BS50DRAFT_496974 [Corynespora cassiicola Philippines]